MVMARYSGVVQDGAGNAVAGASIEVRREVPGQPLAALKSDRAGAVAISNPFLAEADGSFAFHVTGGAYRIRAYTGPNETPSFEKVLRYEPVGTAAEADVENLIVGGVTIDAAGLLAGRGAFDGEDPGFTYFANDTELLYVRLSGGGWSSGVSLEGPAGEPGASFSPDEVVPLFADRDDYDDEEKGFAVLVEADSTNDDEPTLYFKLSAASADWSGGFTFSGGGDVAAETHGAASKAIPVDADELPLIDSAASFILKKLTWTNLKAAIAAFLVAAGFIREKLSASRTYYVRADLGAATVTIATPGVWTLNAHGLSSDDPVVVSIKPDTASATISAANPAVVTMTNAFAAGQPIKFSSTGYLPAGVIAGTTYYVLASGLSGAGFQFSTAPGGTAVNTTAISSSFTNASSTVTAGAAHNLRVGQRMRFAGSVATNFSAGVDYFVRSVPTSTTFTVSATNGGSAISAGSTVSGGTIVQTGTHYVEKAGALPTGLNAGTVYYARNVTTNTFELASAPGGASIATSGSQSGIFNIATGNDANDGLAATRAGAFLTIQKALNVAAALDLSIYNMTAQLADSHYTAGGAVTGPWLGSGNVRILGNATTPANVLVNPTSADGFRISAGGRLRVGGVKIVCATSGFPFIATGNSYLNITDKFEIGAAAFAQIVLDKNSVCDMSADYTIFAGASYHYFLSSGARMGFGSRTVTLTGTPAFGAFAFVTAGASAELPSLTFSGSATGSRYDVNLGGVINTSGADANYFPGNSAGSTATGGQYV